VNGAEKLWDLANLVTGFAIAQSLAFIFSMAKDDFKTPNLIGHWLAFVGTVGFTIGYIVENPKLQETLEPNCWPAPPCRLLPLFALATVDDFVTFAPPNFTKFQ
jgi:hypothetical protein